MCTLANSEDPDEMQHNTAFHLCQHCLLLKIKTTFKKIHYNLENSTFDPLQNFYDMLLVCYT